MADERRRRQVLDGAARLLAELRDVDPDIRLEALAIDAYVRYPEVIG